MLNTAPPTDQRAGVRPIAFALENGGAVSSPVTLKIRPEDLTRSEPSRTSVTQTLGREVQGWVDNFGAGLPTVNISGHTGWRTKVGNGLDGVRAFEELNTLIQHDYHNAKQRAIDGGQNPARVKLLFIDMLDGFSYSVTPINFTLKRSKSRPLLMMYNIQLQAIDTSIDSPFRVLPFAPNLSAGLRALDGVIGRIERLAADVQMAVDDVVRSVDKALAPFAETAADFADATTRIYRAVWAATSSINNGISGTAASLIAIASDLSVVGVNVFRSLSAIESIPENAKYSLARVASAYNEALCIFENSLKPKSLYQDYDGLYGASNCSSTSGGRPPSPYELENTFALIQPERGPATLSSDARASARSLARVDPVLAPVPLAELDRHLRTVNEGLRHE